MLWFIIYFLEPVQNYFLCVQTGLNFFLTKHKLKHNFFQHCGLMVRVLDPGLNSLGSSPGRGQCVVFFTYFKITSQHLTLPEPLHSGV